jgi:hypothetical protein
MAVGERGPRGYQGPKGPKGDTGDSLSRWINDHPGTVLYIAIMVTASVFLQLLQAWS